MNKKTTTKLTVGAQTKLMIQFCMCTTILYKIGLAAETAMMVDS